MRKILALLLGMYLCCTSSLAQVSFTGSSSSVSTDDDASPVVVDNAVAITTTHSIDGARVSITSNYVSGDNLSYTTALLPSGVTGSYISGLLTFTGSASASDYQSLLRSVTFTASANGASNRVIEFYLGSTYLNTTNNHYYKYVPGTNISWTSAKAGAASINHFGLTGYLATITSVNENPLVQGLIPTSDVNAAAWIGASDEYSLINAATGTTTYADQNQAEGKFYWVTGPEAGTLFSTGNTNPVVEYIDNNTLNGTNYYQIAVVDEDGKQTFSEVRSILIKGKLQVYPTVFTRHFIVNQSYNSPGLLTITNASGSVLFQKTIRQGTTNVDAGFLTSGVYFVQISNGPGKPEVFKIIKR